jgi:hypothetical protein
MIIRQFITTSNRTRQLRGCDIRGGLAYFTTGHSPSLRPQRRSLNQHGTRIIYWVNGTVNHSEVWPAAVEAQLRVILRGIDLMIDRAIFTLLETSCRSRCWMNTYWKDNFWPHEFKTVGCMRNYVDTWKRFIC